MIFSRNNTLLCLQAESAKDQAGETLKQTGDSMGKATDETVQKAQEALGGK